MDRAHNTLDTQHQRPTGRVAVGLVPWRVEQLGLLRTPRLLLRPLRETDRSEYLRIVRENRRHMERCAGFARTGESDEALFERHLAATRDGDRAASAWRRVGVTDDGRIIGGFNLATISRGLVFEADATWWVIAPCCGVGFASEGVQAMLDYAFCEIPGGLGLHRVNAAIRADNDASRRLARRAGFTHRTGESLSVQHGGSWVAHELWTRVV